MLPHQYLKDVAREIILDAVNDISFFSIGEAMDAYTDLAALEGDDFADHKEVLDALILGATITITWE